MKLGESFGFRQCFKSEQITPSIILCSFAELHHPRVRHFPPPFWKSRIVGKLSCYVIHSVADLRRWCSHKLFSSPTIAGLPAKLNSAQLRRQAGGQCLGQIMCRRWMFTCAAALSQVGRRHMRTRLNIRPIITRHSIWSLVWKQTPLSARLVYLLWPLEPVGRDGFRHSRQTRKHKSRIPCPIFGESLFPGNSQIPDPVNTFIVFPIPAPYFGQIPNPAYTLPDPEYRVL